MTSTGNLWPLHTEHACDLGGLIELVSQFHHQHADKQITMPFDMHAVVFDDIHQCYHQ